MNNAVITHVAQARRLLIDAKDRLRPYVEKQDVQLAFEDLANELWIVESKIADAYYPFMAANGVFGSLGPAPVAPINIVRRTRKIHYTPLGSGLPVQAFQGVPADVPANTLTRLQSIIRRAAMVCNSRG